MIKLYNIAVFAHFSYKKYIWNAVVVVFLRLCFVALFVSTPAVILASNERDLKTKFYSVFRKLRT